MYAWIIYCLIEKNNNFSDINIHYYKLKTCHYYYPVTILIVTSIFVTVILVTIILDITKITFIVTNKIITNNFM